VKFGSGPAAVIGDKIREIPLFGNWMGRCGWQDDPKVRRPALSKKLNLREVTKEKAASGSRKTGAAPWAEETAWRAFFLRNDFRWPKGGLFPVWNL